MNKKSPINPAWNMIKSLGWGTTTTDYDRVLLFLKNTYTEGKIKKLRDFASARVEELGKRVSEWEKENRRLKKRTFGYYFQYTDALNAIELNQCDMQEYLYQYLVLEKIGEGIHPFVIDEQWFTWNKKSKMWETCQNHQNWKGL
jgi:hypothetical protein